MAKIELDKYYTPKDLAEYCVNKTKEIIGVDNITEWLEPSAGGGSFLNHLPSNTLAYDIAPEDNRDCKNNQAKFKCVVCGHEDNADINAAKNIAIPNIDRIIDTYIKEIKKVG